MRGMVILGSFLFRVMLKDRVFITILNNESYGYEELIREKGKNQEDRDPFVRV
jgi:hypothetical protein